MFRLYIAPATVHLAALQTPAHLDVEHLEARTAKFWLTEKFTGKSSLEKVYWKVYQSLLTSGHNFPLHFPGDPDWLQSADSADLQAANFGRLRKFAA